MRNHPTRNGNGNLERKKQVFGINCKVLKMRVFRGNMIEAEHGKMLRFGE